MQPKNNRMKRMKISFMNVKSCIRNKFRKLACVDFILSLFLLHFVIILHGPYQKIRVIAMFEVGFRV